MGKYTIPLRSIRKVMETAGAKRISNGALLEMENLVKEYITDVTTAALVILQTTGKITLTREHIRAAKRIRR